MKTMDVHFGSIIATFRAMAESDAGQKPAHVARTVERRRNARVRNWKTRRRCEVRVINVRNPATIRSTARTGISTEIYP